MNPSSSPLPFTLVLAGGGARGDAHVGVLRGLEHLGLKSEGIVGVSIGAIEGFTFAARPVFGRFLDTLDFGSRRACVVAGIRAVQAASSEIERVLTGPPSGAT